VPSPSSLDLAIATARAADDKKAEDIMIIDLRGISSFSDFFVICSGGSEPQLKAIANSIRAQVHETLGIKPDVVDGLPASQWMVVSYGDVLVHIMHKNKRDFYALETLWGEAPCVEWQA